MGSYLLCSQSLSFSIQHLGFLINHINLIKKGWGELYKALDAFFSWAKSSSIEGGGGRVFILVPQKLVVDTEPVKTTSFDLENWN
jgi:hypothetical protein